MQNLIIINLKPNASLTRYGASGWRKASLDGADAVDGVIVRLLSGGWRLTSASDSTIYFTRENTNPIPDPKPLQETQVAKVIPVPPPPEMPSNAFNQPLRSGEMVSYEREHASYEKPLIAPIYVRPVPELAKEQSVPQPAFIRPAPERVDLDDWLKS